MLDRSQTLWVPPVREKCPGALHVTERWANNVVESDHGQLKARLRPMRGLKRQKTARVVVACNGLTDTEPRCSLVPA
ncbi:MAG: DDE-type integrase/transposase/recombinase [Candidatus Dormibacteria bacterium]